MPDRSQGRGARIGANTTPRRLAGVDQAAIAAIETLQPYDRRHYPQPGLHFPGHELWLLEVLSNIDKHRYPVVLATSQDWHAVPVDNWKFETPSDPRLVEGAELLRVFFPVPSPNVDVKPYFRYAIAFGDEGPARYMPVTVALDAIRVFIQGSVIEALRPFLP